jgi:hypothetical protein
LLDNAARPSGALVYSGGDGTLSEDQYERLKAELAESFSGSRNAGRPLLLEGGLDWKALSLSPKDMDFMEAKHGAAREIALAFGVPPLVLGIPGDATYANYQEANRSFWRQTVLPLAARTAQSLAHWLGPAWPGALRLEPDLDRIDALSVERGELWSRVGAADFLTRDEKRAAVGYGADEGRTSLKGGWGGLDPLDGDVTATPRGGGGVIDGGDGPGGSEHWRSQPRVPAGDPDGGQWTSDGGTLASRSRDDDLVTGAGIGKEHLDLTVQQFMSRFCLGNVRSVMPSEFLQQSIREVEKLKTPEASRCLKLLKQERFRK